MWDQHEDILKAVIAGDAAKAEELARQHITRTAGVLLARMTKQRERSAVPAQS
ncbi:MAG: FCD domain-containing protein [Bradyrhizobium sp.]|uniref:FCD domain-containing protein n=1 Tax=Bradyrhizobium sp. TaxID=376 RepID=UPI0029019CA3|nr:FCD domain-containing protein [Bradyrhizobium sp.]MDU3133135.1 FCD domain-containing protein [Bradyrhizobium sp.]